MHGNTIMLTLMILAALVWIAWKVFYGTVWLISKTLESMVDDPEKLAAMSPEELRSYKRRLRIRTGTL